MKFSLIKYLLSETAERRKLQKAGIRGAVQVYRRSADCSLPDRTAARTRGKFPSAEKMASPIISAWTGRAGSRLSAFRGGEKLKSFSAFRSENPHKTAETPRWAAEMRRSVPHMSRWAERRSTLVYGTSAADSCQKCNKSEGNFLIGNTKTKSSPSCFFFFKMLIWGKLLNI